MLVVMRDHASQEIDRPRRRPPARGRCRGAPVAGEVKTIIGVIGEREIVYTLDLEGLPGVEEVIRVLKPYKLVTQGLPARGHGRPRGARDGRRRGVRRDGRARAPSSPRSR